MTPFVKFEQIWVGRRLFLKSQPLGHFLTIAGTLP